MKMNTNNKDDIKRMMKDHARISTVTKDIDSPYAKYNSRGQLMCIVCGIPVKSKIIWQAHVNKRSHKENIVKLKERQEKITNFQYSKNENSRINASVKKEKLSKEKPKGILKNISTYDDSSEDDDNTLDVKPLIVTSIKRELPSSFFDENEKTLQEKGENNKKLKTDETLTPVASNSTDLPEGFFDDPVADAKARKVEYHDKEAEEWLSFMKELSAAEVESRQIIAEDKVEAAFETQIEQTNEQIKCLERIVELDKVKKDQLLEKKQNTEHNDSGDSSDEEFSPVIWRTKNSLI